MSWLIKATEDVEMALERWIAAHPGFEIIARTEDGVWFHDGGKYPSGDLHSSGMVPWAKLLEWDKANNEQFK